MMSRTQRRHSTAVKEDPRLPTPGPVDRGDQHGWNRYGWSTVLAFWTYSIMWTGIMKGLAMMIPTLEIQFVTKTWVLGWITSLIIAIGGLAGIFCGLLTRRFDSGVVVLTCGVLISTAGILGSMTNNAVQMTIVYTLLAGIPLGVLSIVLKVTIGKSFNQNYATAIGIGRTGQSVGLFVFPPLIQELLSTYGWKGTMLMTGALSAHIIACGALMKSAKRTQQSAGSALTQDYHEVAPDIDNEQNTQNSTEHKTATRTIRDVVFNSCDVSLLYNPRFWLVTVTTGSTEFAFVMWFIYFVSLAESVGLSLDQAAICLTIGSVGNLLAKIGQGFMIDCDVVSPWCMMVTVVILSAVSYFVMPWLSSYSLMAVCVTVVLTGQGVLACLNDSLNKQVLGVELMAAAYGWGGIITAVLRISLGFLPGLMYGQMGNYIVAFTFIGCVQFLPVISLTILRCCGYMD